MRITLNSSRFSPTFSFFTITIINIGEQLQSFVSATKVDTSWVRRKKRVLVKKEFVFEDNRKLSLAELKYEK